MVATRVTEAVDATRGAVQSGVDMTKSVVTSGVQSVLGSRVGQMVLSGVDTVLGKSEEWVDNHLPMTDAELGECGPRPGAPLGHLELAVLFLPPLLPSIIMAVTSTVPSSLANHACLPCSRHQREPGSP